MNDYGQRNAESRARLVSVCERINDEQLARIAFGEWTISAVFAHLAFWDRITLARWNIFEKERKPVTMLGEPVNAAGAADWLAIPPRTAVRLVLDAAYAVDKRIEATRTVMNPRMFERFHHREEHLSTIERII